MELVTRKFLVELGDLLKRYDAEIVISTTKERSPEIKVTTRRRKKNCDSFYLGNEITEEGLYSTLKTINPTQT